MERVVRANVRASVLSRVLGLQYTACVCVTGSGRCHVTLLGNSSYCHLPRPRVVRAAVSGGCVRAAVRRVQRPSTPLCVCVVDGVCLCGGAADGVARLEPPSLRGPLAVGVAGSFVASFISPTPPQ